MTECLAFNAHHGMRWHDEININPVSNLISVPMQFNYDKDMGIAENGDRWLLNVEPVIPFSLNEKWNLISRTILPVISQGPHDRKIWHPRPEIGLAFDNSI